ncbi:MAG: Ppx/GppA family phosphatase [Acidiferrobacterales bacterium]|nr:Ppx/GppA family phosphatase [Acidiferrobacterales bacterium]
MTNKIQPELEKVIQQLTSEGFTSGSVDDQTNKSNEGLYAAVDLGSNSFHLVISRYEHGEFVVIDRQREVVRLAGGLNKDNILSFDVSEKALQCLKKFGQLLRGIPANRVRVVGTNALRRLKNKGEFLEQAEKALGHSIEIIAGREEARLIYLGVSKWSAVAEESRLVIDIGGGSTEIIAGDGDKPLCRESLEMGCVVYSKRFFSDGVLTKERFDQAKLAAELKLQPVIKQFRLVGWNIAIGCSGTMKSLAQVADLKGLSTGVIKRGDLHSLLERVIECGHIDQLNLPSLSNDRRPVFAGGFAILLALFEIFDIDKLSVSDIALREGVLYDLVGRSSAEDIRDVTVGAMLNRWAVDAQQGQRVRETALRIFSQIAVDWDIQDALFRDALSWSASLHELGLLISHDQYQKHGAYVVENADMAGFAKRDQHLLSALILGHRSKIPIDRFEKLPSVLVTPAKRVAIILRIAVLLHRGRNSFRLDSFEAAVQGQQIKLRFADNFLTKNPLTQADLQREQTRLKSIGVKISFS